MQYLLSEEEYNKLISDHKAEISAKNETIEHLCRVIANFSIDIKPFEWEEATGNRCIKDGGRYCYGCPVKLLCPTSVKQWPK